MSVKKNNNQSLYNLLYDLPEEIHKKIVSYNRNYINEIPRWDYEKGKWRPHCNVKCKYCNRRVDTVSLSHYCECEYCRQVYYYLSGRRLYTNIHFKGVCDNTLICWDCAH